MAVNKAPRGSRPAPSSAPKTPRTVQKPGTKPTSLPSEYRLQKFLASAGLGSRRQCEELIRTGRVTVDGLPVENPGINVDPVRQVIEYDGERLKPEQLKYFVLNKPKGVLCTNHDPGGRVRVIDLFSKERIRLFTVGRLDEESEGLLIVTNDGDLAHQLAHPSFRIYRTYRVQVAGHPTDEKLAQMREGLYFREGKFRVMQAKRVGKQGQSSFLEVVLGQGHNREVRRLFARIGHKVMSLQRIAFGPIKLGKLKSGEYRPVTPQELLKFNEILERNRSESLPQAPKKKKTESKPPAAGAKRKRPAGEEAGSIEKKRIRRPEGPRTATATTKPKGKPSAGSSTKKTTTQKSTEKKTGAGSFPRKSGTAAKGKPRSSAASDSKPKSGPKTYDFG